jgi:SAM-dependent methyltransferase
MSDVEQYYDKDPQYEWERLSRNRTEYAVTMRAFKEYFPQPPAHVLDIGGGPSRYSIALAHQGYTVMLVDLSTRCLEFARKQAEKAGVELPGYLHKNALDLEIAQQVDVVLLMGPLYHLLRRGDRKKAACEAGRLLKKNGLVFASFVTRYAPIRWVGKYEPQWIRNHPDQCKQLINTGKADPPAEESFINYTWFAHPSEIAPLMEEAGFHTVDLIACEGVVSFIDEKINELTGDIWERWVDLNYCLGKDPSVHGTAEHLLYVGKK